MISRLVGKGMGEREREREGMVFPKLWMEDVCDWWLGGMENVNYGNRSSMRTISICLIECE